MTDLEMTRLCAEAMKYEVFSTYVFADPAKSPHPNARCIWVREFHDPYDPLHDDPQAMELVKRFPRDCFLAFGAHCDEVGWEPLGLSLNRAIVECVAKLQSSKKMQKAKNK